MSHVLRLCLVSHPLSPVLRLHSLYPVLTSLFLVSCPLSPVSRLCSLSPGLCILSHGICPLFPLLLSPSPNLYQLSQCPLYCGSFPLFLSFVPLFTVLCSSVSCPLPFVFHTCENARYRTRTFRRMAMS
jgi:hypothetical protein